MTSTEALRRSPHAPGHTSDGRSFTLDVALGRVSDPDPDGLVPDVLLPVQLGWGARQDSRLSGSRALMLAVLQDAIHCLLVPRGSGRLARDAETWIRTDDPAWPMSFPKVCEALGFAPGKLRAALLARAAAATSARAPWKLRMASGRTQRRGTLVAPRHSALRRVDRDERIPAKLAVGGRR